MKALIKKWLRGQGYELNQLYVGEQKLLPPDMSFSYREAQCYIASSYAGQISIDEARLLSALVRSSDPSRPIIEVGTLFGHSTMVLALAKQRDQPLISVDNYSWNHLGVRPDVHRVITRDRLKQAIASHNVTLLDMSAAEFYASYEGPPPALYFCDADHSYDAVRADLLWARSAGATIICGDDYEPDFHPGLVQAVNELGGVAQLSGGLYVLKQ